MKTFTLIDKAFLLKQTPLFSSLDLHVLLPIADKLSPVDCDQGDEIFGIGQEAFRIYFVARGTVSLRDKDQKTRALLSVGDFFGDESLFSEKPRAYAAYCESDALLLSLTLTHLLAIISEFPTVALGFLRLYANKLDK